MTFTVSLKIDENPCKQKNELICVMGTTGSREYMYEYYIYRQL